MTRLLVVGCGFPQLSLVRAARRHGLFVVGADANPHAVGVPHCNEFAPVSTGDVDGLCEVVRAAGVRAVTTSGSEVSLKATVKRAAGDTGPLELTLKFQACSDKTCLLPATKTLKVP